MNSNNAEHKAVEELGNHLEKPEVVELVLAGFKGYHCIGVIKDPENITQLAVYLGVQGADGIEFPSHLEYQDRQVRIVVDLGWTIPTAG